MLRIAWSLISLLVTASLAGAEDRVARLEGLVGKWQQLHDSAGALKKQRADLLDKYKDLDRRADAINKEINQHEREIDQARKKKQANNNPGKGKDKGKKNNDNDRREDQRLDQQIRDDQKKISELKPKLEPLKREAGQVSDQGKKVEKDLASKYEELWAWRNDWGDAADLELSASREQHAAALKKLEDKGGKGPMGEAWKLARAAAQAGTGRYDEALQSLESLAADDVWETKASALRAFVHFKQGHEEKANSQFVRAVKLDNKDPHYYLLRGIVDVQRGKYADARRALANAAKQDAERDSVLRWTALAYALEANPTPAEQKEALAAAQKAVQKTNRQEWSALDALAAAQAASGEFKKAAESEEAAAKMAPEEHRGACESRARDYASGKRGTYTW